MRAKARQEVRPPVPAVHERVVPQGRAAAEPLLDHMGDVRDIGRQDARPADVPRPPPARTGSRRGCWNRRSTRSATWQPPPPPVAPGRCASGRPPRPGRAPRSRAGRPSSSAPAGRGSPTSAGSPPSIALASAWSGMSFASLTRQRPWSCSTISFESRAGRPSRAPSSPASSSARDDARVTRRRCWSGRRAPPRSWRRAGAAGSQRVGAVPSIRAAPSDAGPGLPRAAPSVRMTRCGHARGRLAGARSTAVASAPRSRELTSRIAWVMWIPRGQASVQLKIVRQRHTPSLSARISSRSSAAVVARVEDEPVGVDDRGRTDVRRLGPERRARRRARRAQDALGRVVVARRGPRPTGAARGRAAGRRLRGTAGRSGTSRRSPPCRRRGP